MKLGEALLRRTDLRKRMLALRERVEENALIQEGDEPNEDPAVLIQQADALLDELEHLIFAINKANFENALPGGTSLTRALAKRDVLTFKHGVLIKCADSATRQPERYGTREIKWVSSVSVAAIHDQADRLAQEIRELNTAIQEANWRIDIEL